MTRQNRTNFAEVLLERVSSGGEPALVTAHGTTTYEELAGRVFAVARFLAGWGISPSDRVALFLPRGTDAAAAFLGVLACGGIAVTVNESLRPRQIEHILRHSGARALVTVQEMLDRLPSRLTPVASILSLDGVPASDSFPVTPRIGGDVAHIIYTSGSTGLPKGVVVSHGNLWAGMEAVVSYLGITREDRIASLLPFSFDYGLNQLLCCLGTGASLVVESSPVPQRIIQTLRRSAATILPAVPPLWLQLLSVTSFESQPLPSLRVMTNTGGRLPTDSVRRLRACQPHASLVLMYGLTEAFRSAYLTPEKIDRKPNSVGRAIPGAELLVLDEDLAVCAASEVGELVHRGPTVAQGYWKDPEATARVFRPNPVRPAGTPDGERVVFSGDLVYYDDEGDLFFVGRRDGLIKSLGYRVSPDEVVDVLHASGEIDEAVVVAEPDDLRGSLIVAYVVLRSGGDIEQLKSYATVELPRYMQPARFEVRQSLDRTSSGKFDPAATARRSDADA